MRMARGSWSSLSSCSPASPRSRVAQGARRGRGPRSMAAAGWWPLVVLMDMTVKKSPDWFTVDLKPCQLKPKRQKSDSCGDRAAGSQRRLWFIVPSASPLWGQLPPDLVKMKRTSESATWVLKMCRNFFFYFLIYVPSPLQKVCTIPMPPPLLPPWGSSA